MNKMFRLSQLADRLEGQKMFQILEEAQSMEAEGRKIVHLEIGDPDFESPPAAIEAAVHYLRTGHTHYVGSCGLEVFRKQAAEMTFKSRGFRPDIRQILVTPGANIQIYLAIATLVDPGQEVIIFDPSFVSYRSILQMCGVRIKAIPLREDRNFSVDPEELSRNITTSTRMVIINSPHNPTGSVLDRSVVNEVFAIAEKHNLYLLSDEVYGRMVFNDELTEFASPATIDECQERTIIVHSFSKSYAMTGWRIGAVTAPAPIIKKMALLLETITSCVSPFIQLAAVHAMTDGNDYVEKMMNEFRQRRDLIVSGLNEIDGVSCIAPGGTFYAFPNIRGTGVTSECLSERLLKEAGVATCPGNYFGPSGEGYIRLCFAASRADILLGLDRMKNFLNSYL